MLPSGSSRCWCQLTVLAWGHMCPGSTVSSTLVKIVGKICANLKPVPQDCQGTSGRSPSRPGVQAETRAARLSASQCTGQDRKVGPAQKKNRFLNKIIRQEYSGSQGPQHLCGQGQVPALQPHRVLQTLQRTRFVGLFVLKGTSSSLSFRYVLR